jgi:F0F1-type ATP synthase assembly protein I
MSADRSARLGETVRSLGALSAVGLSFVLAIVLGAGGGYLLDGWLGTSPWGFLFGFALGVVAGIRNVFKASAIAQPPPRHDV